MNNVQFLAWLQENDACQTAVQRVGGQSAKEVWDTWDNPSELLWWVEKSGLVSTQELTLLICGIVRNTPLANRGTVWDLLADERSRNAVEVTERWAHGKATDSERAAWAAEAWAAEAEAGRAAAGAAWAAWAAARQHRIAQTAARAARAGAWAASAASRAAAVGRAEAGRAAWAGGVAAARVAEASAGQAVEAAAAWAGAGAAERVWQLDYIREQLPDFVERFTQRGG